MTLIRFATGKGLASAMIRFATWDWCSHVSFAFGNASLLDSTQAHGVALRHVEDEDFMHAEYYEFVGDPAIMDRAVNWARTQIGKPYDWTGIIGLAVRNRNWHEDDSWFCSELVAEAFEKAGMPLLDLDDCYRITPRDLRISPLLRRTQ